MKICRKKNQRNQRNISVYQRFKKITQKKGRLSWKAPPQYFRENWALLRRFVVQFGRQNAENFDGCFFFKFRSTNNLVGT